MEGEWTDVKSKKKAPKKQQEVGPTGSAYGGVTAKGTLVAGPIQQPGQGRFGGGAAWGSQKEVVNHASTVADYDFGVDNEYQAKFEVYSHVCSSAVSNARMAAQLTQAQLATKVNEKTSTIVELENGSGRYDASLINRIETALRVQIPRGRKPQTKQSAQQKKRY